MEEKFNLAWEGSGCVFTIKGRVEKADMRRLALRQTGIEHDARPTHVIVDLLEADYSQVTLRDISLAVAHTFSQTAENPGMKLAIVATDPHVVKMCQYYLATMAELDMRWKARMFETMADARAWAAA